MFCSRCGAKVADGTVFCPQCGLPAVTSPEPIAAAPPSGAAPPLPPSPPVSAAPRVAEPQYRDPYAAPPPRVEYAGFWLRVVAAIIDYFIIAIPFGIIFLLLFAGGLADLTRNQGEPTAMLLTFLPRFVLLGLIYIIGAWLYWAKMESSSWQATLGKKALGLYVTDLNGRPVGFGQASGRFWAGRGLGMVPYLGGLYFLISCICAGLTERKQAIHDMIASCLVLRRA
jgi:uncharacterized RDD family membrane protein YckC